MKFSKFLWFQCETNIHDFNINMSNADKEKNLQKRYVK